MREALTVYQGDTNTPARKIAGVQSRLGGALTVIAFIDPSLTSATREPKLTEAETLLKQGEAGLEQNPKSESKYKRDNLERFIRLYEAWPKSEKSAEWKQKLEAFDKTR